MLIHFALGSGSLSLSVGMPLAAHDFATYTEWGVGVLESNDSGCPARTIRLSGHQSRVNYYFLAQFLIFFACFLVHNF